MTTRSLSVPALAVALLGSPAPAACQAPAAESAPEAGSPAATIPEPVTLPRTEVLHLPSRNVQGVTYQIRVALPRGYAEGTEGYPVIYLLDADYSFAIARNVVEHLADRNRMEWAIVVGIAYDGPPRYRENRTRDYTPTHVPTGGYGPDVQRLSGGGPAFRDFLAEELVPLVERTYRTTGERALVGHSYGALFGTWVALTRPSLFDHYVLVSPSLWYDDGMAFDVEAEYAVAHRSLPASLFLAVGSREGNAERAMVGDLRAMADRLRGRGFRGLSLTAEVLDGETHDSVFPRALSDGLRSIRFGAGGPRRMAITIDDLPVGPPHRHSTARQEEITGRLLATLAEHDVPAIGFVNESKLVADGAVEPRRVALLERWLDAGLELGNHGYDHLDLHRVAPQRWTADVLKGERVLRRLLEARGEEPRWFRHPFLHIGRSAEIQAATAAFLADHGYRIAPVTVDNDEWVYADVYADARERGDEALMERLGEDYVRYMLEMVEFYEGQALEIVGEPIPQTLLIHANALNADRLGALLDALEARGYRWVPLEEAVEHPAYDRPVGGYTGAAGITWLQRWAITEGRDPAIFRGEPEVPAWVEALRAGR